MTDKTEAFICEAVRTPIGRFAGALAHIRTDDLAAIPIRALVERCPALDPNSIDEVLLGCANQAGEDNRDVARMASLLAGLPVTVPGVTLNRLCASGLDAVGTAARAVQTGQIALAIAGGVESMSRAPFVQGKATAAFQRTAAMEDTTIGWRFVNPLMKAQYGIDAMPETAENVAEVFRISREDQDLFAWQSQRRAATAQSDGYFAEEIVGVRVTDPTGRSVLVDQDEHPRPDTDLAALAKLRTPFKENGTVTAGNASGVNDGAAALFVASEKAACDNGLTPRARILGMATAGVEPRLMGIGPVPATTKLMDRLGLTMSDFDLVELNEAFAAQALACLRRLGMEASAPHVNPHGGAIALGHPLGMSGTRLTLTALHGLERVGGRRALVTMCVGVGQGVSIAIERV